MAVDLMLDKLRTAENLIECARRNLDYRIHGDLGQLEALADLRAALTTVESAIGTQVRRLRQDDLVPWSQIADKLQVTKQAAQQRYGGPVSLR